MCITTYQLRFTVGLTTEIQLRIGMDDCDNINSGTQDCTSTDLNSSPIAPLSITLSVDIDSYVSPLVDVNYPLVVATKKEDGADTGYLPITTARYVLYYYIHNIHTHTHTNILVHYTYTHIIYTYTYTYAYVYMCMCVCVCAWILCMSVHYHTTITITTPLFILPLHTY